MNNKTNEVSHHSVALSCLQTVQYNVIITRLHLYLSLHVVCVHVDATPLEVKSPERFIYKTRAQEIIKVFCTVLRIRKAIYEEVRNRFSHVYLVSFEQVHQRGEITIKVLFFLTLIQNIYNIYIEYKTKKKRIY